VNPSSDDVAAVIVTYNALQADLGRLLTALDDQVKLAVLVENGESVGSIDNLPLKRLQCDFVRLGRNTGLGCGQNLGIAHATGAGFPYILLLDQDSFPLPGMAGNLLRAHKDLTARGICPGAVGPIWVDGNGKPCGSFVQIRNLGNRTRAFQAVGNTFEECSYLASSGSLISAECLRNVGRMREELFIDQIDVEWCRRAGSLGYRHFGIGLAKMEHQVGLATRRYWMFGWRHESVQHPDRIYYLARNIFRVWVLEGSWPWRISGMKLVLGIFMASIQAPDAKWLRLSLLLRGIVDGLRGRLGRLSDRSH